MDRGVQGQNLRNVRVHGFRDYAKFVTDLGSAINDEASAVKFYAELENAVPDRYGDFVDHARNDEISHEKIFRKLYYRLTGSHWTTKLDPYKFNTYREGVETAFRRELEAAEKYRDMYLNTKIPKVRDILFKVMTDEMEHAQRFNFIFALPESST